MVMATRAIVATIVILAILEIIVIRILTVLIVIVEMTNSNQHSDSNSLHKSDSDNMSSPALILCLLQGEGQL